MTEYLYITSNSDTLIKLNPTNMTNILEATTPVAQPYALATDGEYLYAAVWNRIIKFHPRNLQKLEETGDGELYNIRGLLYYDGYLYVMHSNETCHITKLDPTDLSIVTTSPDYTGYAAGPIVTDGTHIYASTANSGKVLKIALSNLAIVSTSANTYANIKCISYYDNFVYIGDTDKKVFKISASTLSQTEATSAFEGSIIGIAADGDYVYAASNIYIYKLNKSDLSTDTKVQPSPNTVVEDIYITPGNIFYHGVTINPRSVRATNPGLVVSATYSPSDYWNRGFAIIDDAIAPDPPDPPPSSAAAKTLYVTSTSLGTRRWRLDEAAPSSVNIETSVLNGKTAAGNYFGFNPGVTQSTDFDSTFRETIDGQTLASGWRSQNAYTGDFVSGNWTIKATVRQPTARAQSGRVVANMYRSSSNSPTTDQLTRLNSTMAQSAIIALGTTSGTSFNVTFNINCDQNLLLANEYIFVIFNWLITTAGGNAAAECQFSVNAGADQSIQTTIFAIPPTLRTIPATSIESDSAILEGEITNLVGRTSADVFFRYRKVGTSSWTTTTPETLTREWTFTKAITVLDAYTAYEYQAALTYAYSGGTATVYGLLRTFTTLIYDGILIERATGTSVFSWGDLALVGRSDEAYLDEGPFITNTRYNYRISVYESGELQSAATLSLSHILSAAPANVSLSWVFGSGEPDYSNIVYIDYTDPDRIFIQRNVDDAGWEFLTTVLEPNIEDPTGYDDEFNLEVGKEYCYRVAYYQAIMGGLGTYSNTACVGYEDSGATFKSNTPSRTSLAIDTQVSLSLRSATSSRSSVEIELGKDTISLAFRSSTDSRTSVALSTAIKIDTVRSITDSRSEVVVNTGVEAQIISQTPARSLVTLNTPTVVNIRSPTDSRGLVALISGIALDLRSSTESRSSAEIKIAPTLELRSATGSRSVLSLDSLVNISLQSATESRSVLSLDSLVNISLRSSTESRSVLLIDTTLFLSLISQTGSRASLSLDSLVNISLRSSTESRSVLLLDTPLFLSLISQTGSRASLSLDALINISLRSSTESRSVLLIDATLFLSLISQTGGRAEIIIGVEPKIQVVTRSATEINTNSAKLHGTLTLGGEE